VLGVVRICLLPRVGGALDIIQAVILIFRLIFNVTRHEDAGYVWELKDKRLYLVEGIFPELGREQVRLAKVGP
jgi:hypothetical protein